MSQVLRQLPTREDPNLLIGPDRHSDAGVYRVGENLAIVQTVDFFPPLTNDPLLYGRIAAANSLSDVYAMGGRPVSALNVVGFPDDELPLDMLHEILRGGAEKTHEAGAAILGGHSVRDREIKYGLSVTGVIDPERLISNAGACVGDRLILTKPVGTGAMTAAYQKDRIDPELWNRCCEMMATLNRIASEAMVQAGAHGATDITGYGLLGHASEMAEASGVSLEIRVNDVPLLEGALSLYESGFVTRAFETNRDYLQSRIGGSDRVDSNLLRLLYDAQTSGGLLIALPPAAIEKFSAAMDQAGEDGTWREIGEVTSELEPGSPWISLS